VHPEQLADAAGEFASWAGACPGSEAGPAAVKKKDAALFKPYFADSSRS
jgi:hypothetical protein